MAEQTEKAFKATKVLFTLAHDAYEKGTQTFPHTSLLVSELRKDHVIIGQCRPLSKTVRFNVKVIPAGSSGGSRQKKAFSCLKFSWS
ncbi:hypothetical protein HPP92_003778 [Vanilla planifolia]|uniref:Uncharacterized protein n=1 Tax=Vanilla planifolia TaxID=51239 RepID=A0A835VHJ0_VANPL|nr:hypothetical protein HPP92_003778 [Vanilla planifolia]